MFIDTHCHLTYEYDSGIDTVIERAKNVGVSALICGTANPKDFQSALQVADDYKNVFVTIGIHPEYADINPHDYITDEILHHPRVVGIGEIGLDYHYGTQTRDAQIKLFESQLQIATQYNLPVAIHTRDAEDDTKAILTDKYHGVMHCFTSNWNLARTMLDRGFYFSASGIMTFKNSESVRETFVKIPNDRIVIETDSPYCAPIPYRGKQCEPSMVIETAKVLANIKNLHLSELETILVQNTTKLYKKCNVKL